jgi:hypothetical protein
MFDDLSRLDLTAKDLALIETALQTQAKILSLQSQAGAAGARQQLTDLSRLKKRIGRAQPVISARPGKWNPAHLARSIFSGGRRCPAGN